MDRSGINGKFTYVWALLAAVFILLGLWYMTGGGKSGTAGPDNEPALSETALRDTTGEEKDAFRRPRSDYFFRLLRDPATNAIPDDIRSRELQYARDIPSIQQLRRGEAPAVHDWTSAGPADVGGRTRALGIDRRNKNVLIAGGVSGGVWKSTDGGTSWDLKTPQAENFSVTDLVQHPNRPDTWYYVSGEISGNSASAVGAFYYGNGIFRSTDNGENWNRITPGSDDPTVLDTPFDIMSRVVISPATGSVFICSNGYGVYKSTDGEHFGDSAVLGDPVSQRHCDITVTPEGTLYAALSSEKVVPQANEPSRSGVFMSTDDGESWTDITPVTYPDQHGRSVLAYAPSDPEIVYVLTERLESELHQGVSFHKIDLGSNETEDRSEHLPDFRSGGEGSGYMDLQGGYNMVVAVKPDDPDYVLVGATNLFRSTDGFASTPDSGYDPNNGQIVDRYWIGGYDQDNSFSLYPEQHPDQHIAVFDPTDPDRLWMGHDGGLSVTGNLTASEVSWTARNSGYVTSQFYTSAIAPLEDDGRLMGGTQDNGTPFFRHPGGLSGMGSTDISLGDGGYAFFTPDFLYVSRQRGSVVKYRTGAGGNPARFDCVHPSGVNRENLIFIHPYTVDPNDQTVMYYPDENRLLRNTMVDQIDNNHPTCPGASLGWETLHNAFVPAEYTISALEASRFPGNILFYAASPDSSGQKPLIRRLDSAKSSDKEPADISIPDAPEGAWVKDIALNPVNASPDSIEGIVVMSNYNITGVFHTRDSGESWEAIEGNLTGDSGSPGPSIRSAAIVPSTEGTVYLLATSTGLYRTESLEGGETIWGQEAGGQIGLAVTDHLETRVADGTVAAGTHGRGMYLGSFAGSTGAPSIAAQPAEARAGEEITVTSENFAFGTAANGLRIFFNGEPGRILSASPSELRVEVPRGAISPQEETGRATLRVTSDHQTLLTGFRLLPPDENVLSQNYPNPFRGTTAIPLDLRQESRVTLVIYDILGREVYRPHHNTLFTAGSYSIPVDFSDKASGVYIYRVIAEPSTGGNRFVQSEKMTLIN